MTVPNTAADEAAEVGIPAIPGNPIEGRSLGQIAWGRLRRDKVAMVSGTFVLLLILLAIFADVITHAMGLDPLRFNGNLIDQGTLLPYGARSGMSLSHPLGLEPENGRDMFARIVVGIRPSLIVALAATALQMIFGIVIGSVAGYFGGWADGFLSRITDIFLAFPILIFLIAIGSIVPSQAFGLGAYGVHLVVMIAVIGIFTWAYQARLIRGLVLSLRDREFVDAARLLGAHPRRIIFREILPNLASPILVYTSLAIPANIVLEAYLSFLGVGTPAPYPSWGQTLSNAVAYFQVDPTYMLVPGIALFLTVLAFNLLGDGLRDALDPRAGR
ncbi:ABC transporter permease [Actinocrinis puniceicyclus]|uniref:ABC transporter permease n=1 Tax=Actinocrinis puniceicyclus TaxID=977794 RepID=A0A8J8BE03_9ACTN|nr:ABC transporter permease [Actinocrinis puniceicyclus]MBS2963309.1 ABC transporter permease [Actinocrinis puniceicyclus]